MKAHIFQLYLQVYKFSFHQNQVIVFIDSPLLPTNDKITEFASSIGTKTK